jgi:hypothetical protein
MQDISQEWWKLFVASSAEGTIDAGYQSRVVSLTRWNRNHEAFKVYCATKSTAPHPTKQKAVRVQLCDQKSFHSSS